MSLSISQFITENSKFRKMGVGCDEPSDISLWYTVINWDVATILEEKLSGRSKMDLWFYFHMVMMVMDLSTPHVELRDFCSYATKTNLYQGMV
jgi:hypothetical protein